MREVMSLKAPSIGGRGMDVLSPLLTPTIPDPQDDDSIPQLYPGESVGVNELPTCLMSSPSPVDLGTLRAENRALKARIRQHQAELQAEQDTVASMRKKLNSIERDRLDAVAKANEEASRLDSEVARLRAQLERGEAVRQSLEYDLARVRKEVTEARRSASERETLMQGVNDDLKKKLEEVTQQMEELCEDLEVNKGKAEEESRRLRDILKNKDEELLHCRSDRNSTERELQKLQLTIEDKDRLIGDLEDRLRSVEGGSREQGESLRRQVHENEFLKEKEDRLRHDLESAQERIRVLEENIEAERAAHLESKFNSEIVQLRIRDLEAAVELEKTQKAESIATTEKLNKQIRDLQQFYDEERRNTQLAQDKLQQAEKEYTLINQQLRTELEEKADLIKQLSKQLDTHQANFADLKQELNKAKKRQVFLEETYTGSIKELEILLDNFPSPSVLHNSGGSSRKASVNGKTPSRKREGSKTQTLSSLLETLRRTLIDYKRKLDDTIADLSRLKSQHEQSGKEVQQYKDMLWHKDKALETAQQGLARTSKDLRRYQTDARDLEIRVTQLTKDLNTTTASLEKHIRENQELRDQVAKVATKCKTDEKTSGEFLHSLHRQLQYASPPEGGGEHKDSLSDVESWSDLARLVCDQVNWVITHFKQAQSKISQYETVLANKEQTIAELQRAHEEQLHKMSALTDGRSQQWQQQKAELETHYTQLLTEIHARHKKTQALADQAWDRVRATGTVQQSLETQCSQLQAALERCEVERVALLAACALLSGVVFPLCGRAAALGAQRALQAEHGTRWQEVMEQLQALSEALHMEEPENHTTKTPRSKPCHPLQRFRVGVIAVMAANRLTHLGLHTCHIGTVNDMLPGLHAMSVCTGGGKAQVHKFIGVHEECLGLSELHRGSSQLEGWLHSQDLLHTVMATMADLSVALKAPDTRNEELCSLARDSLTKLLLQLPVSFPALTQGHPHAGLRDKSSLLRRLGQGLHRLQCTHGYISPQDMVARLSDQVLAFTQRLHSVEVERRDLRQELSRLREKHKELLHRAELTGSLQKQVDSLQKQVEDTIEKHRFDAVYTELNNALRREEEAQQLLKEQSAQLHQLGLQLNLHQAEGSQKEYVLADAVQGLNEAKIEVKRNELRVRQLTRQMATLEEDKRHLQENIADAESALKTASKDRNNLTQYVRNIQRCVEKMKAQMALTLSTGATKDLGLLLSPDHLPPGVSTKTGGAPAELAACQSLVAAFVELQRHLEARLEAMEADVRSHKQHISLLKQELSEACRREISPQELENIGLVESGPEKLQAELDTPSRTMLGQSESHKPAQHHHNMDDFVPLQLEENSVLKFPTSKPSTPKPKTGVNKKTTQQRSRSPIYQTPQTASQKLQGLQRRPTKGRP